MKFIAVGLVAVCLAALVGCKSGLPSSEKMYGASYSFGVAAALVANMTDMDAATRTSVAETLAVVSTIVPQTNETFEAAWMEKAKQHVASLVEKGKITDAQGQVVLGVFQLAVKGIDYLFVRYPEAKQYEELVVAAIDGFVKGFLSAFSPVASKACCASCGDGGKFESQTYDVRAYYYLLRYRR